MKIYASLTTTPSRLDKIDDTLRSILKDRFDKVFLNLPYVSRRGVRYADEAIELLLERMGSEKLVITRVDQDYGPVTKLIGSLSDIESDAFVVVFDDDRRVKKSVYKVFKTEFERNPRAVFSMGGWIRSGFPTRYKNFLRNTKTVPVDSVMGVTCIGFRRDLIDRDELLNFRREDSRLNNLDDMRISGYLASKGVTRFSIGVDPKTHLEDVYLGGGLSNNISFWYSNKTVMDDFYKEGLFNTRDTGEGASIESLVLFLLLSLTIFAYIGFRYRRNARVLGIMVILFLVFLLTAVNRISHLTL